MKLTRRGQDAIALLLIVVIAAALIGVAWIGQELKRDRLQQEVTQSEVG